MNFGKSVKVALAKKGWNHKQLSQESGLSITRTRALANSEKASQANIERMADVFGYKVSEFIALGEE